MASKIYSSKNIAKQIQTLQKNNNFELIEKILQSKEIKSLLPKILHILKINSLKQNDFNESKIFSKTELDKKTINDLENKLSLVNPKIIIDETMSAGVKIKTQGKLIDATFPTMLGVALKKI